MKVISKKIEFDYLPNYELGEMILIDKQIFKSSFDTVYKVRKAINIKKVGHAGTLDPMATGLLIVCTGKMTKEISTVQQLEKTYSGIISLGKTTPSFDLETEFNDEKSIDGITEADILATRDSFIGKSFQIPPIYSAVKHKGKALYHFARKGIEIKKEPREIFISEFLIEKIDLPDIYFTITCSSGTYIRVIAYDFGIKLGCGAYLKKLKRIKIGEFNVDDAMTTVEFIEYTKNKAIVVEERI
jgi:tRNA pseudouridine55 synthase